MNDLEDSKTPQVAQLKAFYQAGLERLAKLEHLEYEKISAGQCEPLFSELINKMKLVQKHMLLLEDVQEGDICRKRLCIKYRELGVDYVKQLQSKGVAWKYSLLLLQSYKEKMDKEFSWTLQNFESFGDHVFASPFKTRIQLLVRPVDSR